MFWIKNKENSFPISVIKNIFRIYRKEIFKLTLKMFDNLNEKVLLSTHHKFTFKLTDQ